MAVDWHEMGYKRAIAVIVGCKVPTNYPTQDIYTAKDEADFINGYNTGFVDMQTKGIETLKAYIQEKADDTQ